MAVETLRERAVFVAKPSRRTYDVAKRGGSGSETSEALQVYSIL